MAFIENRDGNFRLVFRYGGKRYRRSLLTADDQAAQSALARLEDNLRRVQLGLLDVPATADVLTFLVSDGRTTERPKPKPALLLKELFDAYFAAVPEGHLEQTTLATMRQHVKRLYAHFGEEFSVRTLTVAHLQAVRQEAGQAQESPRPAHHTNDHQEGDRHAADGLELGHAA